MPRSKALTTAEMPPALFREDVLTLKIDNCCLKQDKFTAACVQSMAWSARESVVYTNFQEQVLYKGICLFVRQFVNNV